MRGGVDTEGERDKETERHRERNRLTDRDREKQRDTRSGSALPEALRRRIEANYQSD